MMRLVHLLKHGLLFTALAGAGMLLYGWGRSHPEDLPWTALDPARPIGVFTGRKLTGLTGDAPGCRALLERAGARFTAIRRQSGPGACGYDDGVRLTGGAARIGYRPAELVTSCAVAASLALWEWEVVQPAAVRHFGREVAEIDHFGSYSCRRIYGRASGAWSEHSTADAVDIAGFRLQGGTRISVLHDWEGEDRKAAFLRDVRDGACSLFATTLSPDYNAAHRDHLHLDQAERGLAGWRGCR